MKLQAVLARDRSAEGQIVALADDGAVLAGPWRCRGEADDTAATGHGNAQEDPRRPYGDHPFGSYRVVGIEHDKPPPRTYGPVFLRLAPTAGEALLATRAGRLGLGIHGGDLGPERTLRPTHGCLRLDNVVVETLAQYVREAWGNAEDVVYECVEDSRLAREA